MKKLLIVLLGFVTVGCAMTPDVATVGIKPTNHRELMREFIRSSFRDPYSLRDIKISEPFLGGTVINFNLGSGEGWVVCLTANGKNAFGAYVGQRESMIVIRNGRIVHSLTDTAAMFCSDAQYTSFDPFQR